MPRKRHTSDQIINKLRQAEVEFVLGALDRGGFGELAGVIDLAGELLELGGGALLRLQGDGRRSDRVGLGRVADDQVSKVVVRGA